MAVLSSAEWTAIWLSLKIAVTATIASLPFGILVSYALARWRFPGKIILNAAVHLPLVMPPVVTGFLLLVLFGRKGIFGAFLANIGIVLSFRWTGAAVACAVMGFPLMVRAMQLSFEAIDRRLEQAAGTLGANRMWTFFLVSLPLALPGIIAGAILAFACPAPMACYEIYAALKDGNTALAREKQERVKLAAQRVAGDFGVPPPDAHPVGLTPASASPRPGTRLAPHPGQEPG